ncbi:MAG: TolC family protein [Bacteroidetes bacterium]|nr:TolC family protein [Bacteroidota bacterium]
MHKTIAILFFLNILQIHSQSDSLSAKQAVFIALENNFDLQISSLQEEISAKNNKWSEAGLFPTVTLQVGQNNLIQDNTKNPFTFTPGIILNQGIAPALVANVNLFSGFQVKINKQRLEQLETQSQGNSAVVLENLVRDVLKTYYLALLQKDRSEFYENLLAYSRKRLRYNEIKNEYSGNNSLELLQLKNQYLTDSTNFLLQNLSYENSLRNLKLLMNNDENDSIGQLPVLTDNLNFVTELIEYSELKRKMLYENQNLKNQYINLQLQETNIDFQRSFLYPTLGLQLSANPSYGRFQQLNGGNPNMPNSLSTQSLAYSGNLTLRYSIYNNWKSKRAVEVAKIQTTITELNIEKLKATLTVNLSNLYSLYAIRNNLVNVSTQNLEYAEKAYDLAQKRFDIGAINSVELQVLQNNYQNTQIQHLENLYNRLDTYIDLYQMSGNLRLEYQK